MRWTCDITYKSGNTNFGTHLLSTTVVDMVSEALATPVDEVVSISITPWSDGEY